MSIYLLFIKKMKKQIMQKIGPLINLLIIGVLIANSIRYPGEPVTFSFYPSEPMKFIWLSSPKTSRMTIPVKTGNTIYVFFDRDRDANSWVKWSPTHPIAGFYLVGLFPPIHLTNTLGGWVYIKTQTNYSEDSNGLIYTRTRTFDYSQSSNLSNPTHSYYWHTFHPFVNELQNLSQIHLNLSQESPSPQPYEPLTNREMEVYLGLVEGKSNEEIALELGIKEKTIEAHIKKIFEKTNVCSRVGAATFAFKYGLIDINSVNIQKRYREKPP